MDDNQVIPAPSEEPKASKSSNTGLLAIIFILLIILVGGGAYVFGSRKISQETPTPTPSIEPSPTEELTPIVSPTATKKPTKTPTPTPTPTLTPTPDNRADLYISAYSFNHPPVMGEPFTLSATIYNQGNVASGPFFWEWWATTGAPTYACRENVSSIAAHGGRTVTCTYTYGGWANYVTKAIADVDNGVDESNEGNNTYTQNVVPVH